MTRRTFLLGSLSACAVAAGTLAGCGSNSNPNGLTSSSTAETTKTVTAEADGGFTVTVDVPDSWTTETREKDGAVKISADKFNGTVLLGLSLNGVSGCDDDQEVLDKWASGNVDLTSDWQQVGTDVSPIYEASVNLYGDSDTPGIVRVAICGDYAVSCEGYGSQDDWGKGAKEKLGDVVSTFAVANPVAPSYPAKDVFTIVDATKKSLHGGDFWELDVTVQNNSNEAKQFLGFQIDELDANGNIINSYMSYNKNGTFAMVEPGQQYTIDLTEKGSDGIAGFQSRYCEWGENLSTATKSKYSQVFKKMF